MTAAIPTASRVRSPGDCKPDSLLDRMAQALRSVGCRCEHNVPYAGCKVTQIVERECARCRCLREYDEMRKVAV